MKYLALYRKYRPDCFEKVIGQDHIVKILSSQVLSGNIGHAYLFCGARGTGKTSVAKIFAAAINCEKHTASGSPCKNCDSCKNASDNMDILEMDAASNNKVEDIREIIENAQYSPVSGKYKVYIIDEVHMLTGNAFNALLKTLEEPPAHAVFILATTEVYKLPATILSRCMRFDFKLVPTPMLIAHLKNVFKNEGKAFEEGAIAEIARAGEGSVRDALSIADTCMSAGGEILKHYDVLELLSASDRGKIASLCDNVLKGSSKDVLKGIEELFYAGKSVSVLNKDMLSFFRDLSVIHSCPDEKDMLVYPEDIINIYRKNSYDINRILRCIEIYSSIETELKYSLHPRIIFEAASLKCTDVSNDSGKESFEIRIKALEKEIALLKQNPLPSATKPNGNLKTTDKSTLPPAMNKGEKVLPPLQEDVPNPPMETYSDDIMPPLDIYEDNSTLPSTDEEVQKVTNTENVSATAKRSALPDNDEAEIIWGNVIRTLRQSESGLLFTMCGDLTAKISGNDFIINAGNSVASKILSKPKNLEKLKSIINTDKEYNIIINDKADSDGPKDEDIEKLRELADGNLIIKN